MVMSKESALHILHLIKDYWFLITLLLSAIASVFYMIVFHVNPWETQRAIKLRKDRVKLHNKVGQTLLEGGHYQLAKNQFEETLKLESSDQTALYGQYLGDLFLQLRSVEWDPAVGHAIQKHIAEVNSFENKQMLHIVQMYLGVLHLRIQKPDQARSYMEQALRLKPAYADALFHLGWFHYSQVVEVSVMHQMFLEMTKLDPYDYRGFHGLGYALYMKAVRESSPEKRNLDLFEAARQSEAAKNLTPNRLNIVMDFGEVARCVQPHLSIYFHEVGRQLVENPTFHEAADNAQNIFVQLLLTAGGISIGGKENKLAYVDYQLSLDYLALFRREGLPAHKKEHDLRFKKASDLDSQKNIYPVYVDQLAILDLAMPSLTNANK
jgi:tetratricopeptide (TPR) repeat protein